jgi:hypothetical protein
MEKEGGWRVESLTPAWATLQDKKKKPYVEDDRKDK